MRFPNRNSLRFEIVVSLALLVAAAVGLVGLVVLSYVQNEMIALKIETGLTLARAIEARLQTSRDNREVQRLLYSLTGNGFDRIVVADRAGTALAYIGPWPWDGRPTRTDLLNAVTTRTDLTFWEPLRIFRLGMNPSLALAVPIFKGTEVMGAVGLFSQLTDLQATWDRSTWIIAVYLAADTLVTVLFGTYLLSRRLIKPLRRMLDRVRALADGRYQPCESMSLNSESEIGQLEKAFEDMAGRIIETRARLEQNLATLQETQEGLIHSEKMATVGRLAAGLAHELGNPLGAVLGFVHLLRRSDVTDSDKADFLNRMESELSRMDGIIRSLLDFARPAKVTPGPVNLAGIVDHGLALARVQKWFRGVQVETDLADGLPLVRGETNRLTQVLVNLLANAAQSMADGGVLRIAAGRSGQEVFMSVADTGTGIAEEDLPHIFEPFFTRKEPGQGTGLGLSVSLSIVQSFGGRIEVESEAGRGSVFTVVLPVETETGGV